MTPADLLTYRVIGILPDISGDRVVFSDFRNDDGSRTNSDIYMIDLATGMETQITNDPGQQTRPKISGNNIVWHDSRIGGLVMYRIR